MQIKLQINHPNAIIPTYSTPGAACFDLASIEAGQILPGESRVFRTGLAVEIPEGYKMTVHSRSGHGFKHGIRLSNCTGVIDADYRGEIMIKLHNDRNQPYLVGSGERIAQAEIVPVLRAEFVVADALSETERGAGGFGSTGA